MSMIIYKLYVSSLGLGAMAILSAWFARRAICLYEPDAPYQSGLFCGMTTGAIIAAGGAIGFLAWLLAGPVPALIQHFWRAA